MTPDRDQAKAALLARRTRDGQEPGSGFHVDADGKPVQPSMPSPWAYYWSMASGQLPETD